jgi:hypothetical protein
MSTRFNLVGTIIGQRGTGKTLFLLGSKYSSKPEDKSLSIPGLIDITFKNRMKVLIVDTLDHPAYRHIPVLKQQDFKKWSSGIFRIWFHPDNMSQFVNDINNTPGMNNTFIVFEDAGKYTEKRVPKPFTRLISDSKQRNIDIAFMYHCWVDTPTNIFTKADYIQLFKTEDKPVVRKNYIRLYDKVEAAFNDVNQNPNRFYSRFIDTRTN